MNEIAEALLSFAVIVALACALYFAGYVLDQPAYSTLAVVAVVVCGFYYAGYIGNVIAGYIGNVIASNRCTGGHP